jgi:hypothetical protein
MTPEEEKELLQKQIDAQLDYQSRLQEEIADDKRSVQKLVKSDLDLSEKWIEPAAQEAFSGINRNFILGNTNWSTEVHIQFLLAARRMDKDILEKNGWLPAGSYKELEEQVNEELALTCSRGALVRRLQKEETYTKRIIRDDKLEPTKQHSWKDNRPKEEVTW